MSLEGLFTVIECTSVSHLDRNANDSYVVFKLGNGIWKFAIVSAIYYLQKDGSDGVISLFEWTVTITNRGCPDFLIANCWADMEPHFTLVKYQVNEVNLRFVNQVRGEAISGERINPLTRNGSDGGV